MDDFVHFLDMFASLPQLEGPSAFTGEHLRRLLDERLPLRLFALPLTWVFSKVDDAAFLQEWIAMVRVTADPGSPEVADRTPRVLS